MESAVGVLHGEFPPTEMQCVGCNTYYKEVMRSPGGLASSFSAARRSTFGVAAAWLPKQEKSAQPMSSTNTTTMFGGAPSRASGEDAHPPESSANEKARETRAVPEKISRSLAPRRQVPEPADVWLRLLDLVDRSLKFDGKIPQF